MIDRTSNSTSIPDINWAQPENGEETTEVPAGYVSDAELLAWLQAKSTDEYDKLRGLMDLSQQRSDAIKDLSLLKTVFDGAAADPAAALAQIQAMEARYAGTEFADEVAAATGPMKEAIENYAYALGCYQAAVAHGDVPGELLTTLAQNVESTRVSLEAQATNSGGKLDATIESLGRDDQLALIQIQDLMSNLRQASQLTSNIVAGKAQTADGIVANIRA
jgi:hypothetical protein